MKKHVFTHVACPCGHRGTIVQTYDPAPRDGWYLAWLQDLSNKGTYQGIDSLFAETSPSCPKCGRSLAPENVVGHSELDEAAELLSRPG